MSRTALAAWAAGLALAAALGALLLSGSHRRDLSPGTDIGNVGQAVPGAEVFPAAKRRPLPDFAAERLDGGTLSLASESGHVLVLNFWASWCGPCGQEEAALQRASVDLAGQGVRFVGIDTSDDRTAAVAFRAKYGVTYPSLDDHPGLLSQRLGSLGPRFLPYTLVVDARGRVAARVVGALNRGVGPVEAQVGQLRDLVAEVSGT